METEQYPPPQSPPVVANMRDEGLQSSPQSYEFTSQQHHYQDYGYNLQLFSASREDFMSNLIGRDLRTSEFAYACMQSMLIPMFTSFQQTIVSSSSINRPNIIDFIQKEQPIVPNEQFQPQEHKRVRR